MAGVRNYAANLHADLALGVFIKPGTQTDPGLIADAWYEMYTKQDKAEETFPAGVTPATIIF